MFNFFLILIVLILFVQTLALNVPDQIIAGSNGDDISAGNDEDSVDINGNNYSVNGPNGTTITNNEINYKSINIKNGNCVNKIGFDFFLLCVLRK